MTDFEQQVADRLWQCVPVVIGPGPTLEEIVKEWLAPRVAAAIAAAAAYDCHSAALIDVMVTPEDAALAALRGE